MPKFDSINYKKDVKKAVDLFWDTRSNQNSGSKKAGQGNRSAVTGGKHLDGFVNLMVKVAIDIGIPRDCIHTKGNALPGFFRPTKDWDLLIINKRKHLIAAIEFKSQVGSFGNNFNNRTEEVLGNAIDLWTAFRDKGFPQTTPPWLGYLILVEKSAKSTSPVRVKEPHYNVRSEFNNTSYIDRYKLLCQKLMLEKHYNFASIIWSEPTKKFGDVDTELSIEAFIESYSGFLIGKLNNFK
jgi:hypothetical protein